MEAAKRNDADMLMELDKELADVLTAISVITKQLAKKINVNLMKKEEEENVQVLRTDRKDCQNEIKKT